jgi:hypothetical protein
MKNEKKKLGIFSSIRKHVRANRTAYLAVLAASIGVAGGQFLCCGQKFNRIEYIKSTRPERRGDLNIIEISGVGTCRMERPDRGGVENEDKRREFAARDRLSAYYYAYSGLLYDNETKKYIGTEKIDSILKGNGIEYDISVASDGEFSVLRITAKNPEDLQKIKTILGAEDTLKDYSFNITERSSFQYAMFSGNETWDDPAASMRQLTREDRLLKACGTEAIRDAKKDAEAQAKAMGIRLLGPVSLSYDTSRNILRVEIKYAVE